ncbi:unnamed protein product, partial [Closterium sp. NIES-54]
MARLTAPRTDLLRKGVTFTWGEKEHVAFSTLKNVLCSLPVLRIADPHRPFEVVTDGSDIAIGAVLLQDFGNGLQPIAYESRKLHPPEKNYPIHDREMLAIVHAFKVWRCYLTGADVTEAHDGVTSGHFGVEKTRHQLQRYYYWPEMLTDVQRHVASCPTCQVMKSSWKQPAGQLQPIPPPERAWQQVTMDFVTGLPAGATSPAADNSHLQQQQQQQHQYQQPMYGMPLSSQPNGITLLGEPGKFTLKYGGKKLGTAVEQNGVFVLNFIPERTTSDSDNILSLGPWEHRDDIDYTDDTVPREGVVPTSSTTAAAVMLTFDDQGLNDVQNSREYMAAVTGWDTPSNMPTDDGTWGADEPNETTWGETPAERNARLLAEAEQRVAEMEVLDLGRLVGVDPIPAASDQESGELVLAPGECVDVE